MPGDQDKLGIEGQDVRQWMFSTPSMIARTLNHTTLLHMLHAALVNTTWSKVATDPNVWAAWGSTGPLRWVDPSRAGFLSHLYQIHKLRQLLNRCWWLESRYGNSRYIAHGVPIGVNVHPKVAPCHNPICLNCPSYEPDYDQKWSDALCEATGDGFPLVEMSEQFYNALLRIESTIREITRSDGARCKFVLPDWFVSLAEAMCLGDEKSEDELMSAMWLAFKIGDLTPMSCIGGEEGHVPGIVSLADAAYDDDVNHLCLIWDPSEANCTVRIAAVNHWDDSTLAEVHAGTACGQGYIAVWDSFDGAIEQYISELESWKRKYRPDIQCFTILSNYGNWKETGDMVWYDDDTTLVPQSDAVATPQQ